MRKAAGTILGSGEGANKICAEFIFSHTYILKGYNFIH